MKTYDLVIIGSGIAGLSASIYAASEGISTLIVDGATTFGGQAATASLIENLIGFPEGISGKELAARAIEQASKFGVEFKSPFFADKMEKDGLYWKITSDDEEVVMAKTVLLAMGVTYRSLEAENVSRFLGTGISYGSPSLSENFKGKTVSVVGGANSAGQAAVYLAGCKECNVNLIVRADSIEKGMSNYLVNKLRHLENITIWTGAEVSESKGKEHLECFEVNTPTGVVEIECDRAFILIGAKPKTHWLEGVIPLDDNGFVLSDKNLEVVPGIFAAGDIRAESVKRVGSALGEGARSVNGVRDHLKWLAEQENLIETI